jgi:enoyl-CoA hydratase
MTADVGTLQRLGKVVPEGFAREMAFTGRRYPAARAYEAGLVQQVLPDHASLVEPAHDGARDRRSLTPGGLGTKVAMNYARDHSVGDALDQIATWQAGMFQPADMAEASPPRPSGGPRCFPDLLPEPEGLCGRDAQARPGAVRRSRQR